MIIPVKCFTCGNILASKHDKYEKLMKSEQIYLVKDKVYLNKPTINFEIINQNKKKDRLDKFLIDGEKKPIESIILDTIGLKRYCCRRHFVGHVDVKL